MDVHEAEGSLPDEVTTRMQGRLARSWANESAAAARLSLRARRWAMLGIAGVVTLVAPPAGLVYVYALILIFVVGGEVVLWCLRTGRSRSWHAYALVTFDAFLLVFAIVYPNPLSPEVYPAPVNLRYSSFIYLFTLLALTVFLHRPLVLAWGAAMAAVAWTLGVLWVLSLPGVYAGGGDADVGMAERLRELADPYFVDIGVRVQEIGVYLIVAAILVAAMIRSRRIVLRQARFERERVNLARYFAPVMVDQLADRDTPLAAPRETEAAVLFVDIVGFTRWAEHRPPAAVIAHLRDVHGRLERLVFEHGGTLDKFIGDGLMATFGTPEPADDAAARAVACVRAVAEAFEAGPRLAIGLHLGLVVLGDVGSARRMEFAVLGDTVNVASRLEQLARPLGVRAVLSDAVVQRSGGPTPGMTYHGALRLTGRDAGIDVWTL
ncbi:MAG: adenylate/guanylate cyclase domain-containing protein [Pseudomonadota bacterium]